MFANMGPVTAPLASPGSRQTGDSWRAGIVCFCNPALLKTSFDRPTAIIFDAMTNLLFRTLLAQEPPQRKAVSQMQRFYSVEASAATARVRFELKSWPGDQSLCFPRIGGAASGAFSQGLRQALRRKSRGTSTS